MNTFNNNEHEIAHREYAEEAKRRWGGTDAYKECEQKTAGYSADKWNDVNAALNAVLAEFADTFKNGSSPESEAAQSLVKKLQACITDNFYTCTSEILSGLGQMYAADERFKSNIDKNGAGTAEFISEAIKFYCI